MIISRVEIESAVAAYRAGIKRVSKSGGAQATSEVSAADAYAPSDEANSLAALRETVIAQPYYRQRLVNELKRRIEEGKYYVPAEQIVEKMLGRLIVENLSSA